MQLIKKPQKDERRYKRTNDVKRLWSKKYFQIITFCHRLKDLKGFCATIIKKSVKSVKSVAQKSHKKLFFYYFESLKMVFDI
jgi:hypothetical protein